MKEPQKIAAGVACVECGPVQCDLIKTRSIQAMGLIANTRYRGKHPNFVTKTENGIPTVATAGQCDCSIEVLNHCPEIADKIAAGVARVECGPL